MNILETGRKRAQRAYPIAEDDKCDHCGGLKTLQRHHIDHNPMNNNPDNIALLCQSCHSKQHPRQRMPVKLCEICKAEFQPRKARQILCGDPSCFSEKGRRSAELRWG